MAILLKHKLKILLPKKKTNVSGLYTKIFRVIQTKKGIPYGKKTFREAVRSRREDFVKKDVQAIEWETRRKGKLDIAGFILNNGMYLKTKNKKTIETHLCALISK